MSWNPVTSRADFVVAKDGSGTHRTINEAVAAAARMDNSHLGRVIIYVKAGVYNENVKIERNANNIMMVGDGMDKTIVTGNQNVPGGTTIYSSATFGKNIKIETLYNWSAQLNFDCIIRSFR